MTFPKFKFKYFIIILSILLLLPFTKSLGAPVNLNNKDVKYRIIDTQDDLIDWRNTNANVDKEERVITLEEIATLPDAIKFIGNKENNNMHDFVVLEKDGLKYYAFTGDDTEPYLQLSSLNIDTNLPFGVAVNPLSQGTPSFLISDVVANGKIKHFYYDSNDGMKESTPLAISGLKYVTSLSTFTETGDVGVLTDKQFKLLNLSGELKEGISFDFNVTEPLSIATGNGFNFSILTETSIQHYKYDGNSLSSIPILEIAIKDEYEKPKSIVIDDKTNSTFLLSDNKVTRFKLNEATMNYNIALSIGDLINPVSMAYNSETGGILIIDNIDRGVFKAKYYMLSGDDRYIYNPSMSIMLGEMITSGEVKRYTLESTVHLGSFTTDYEYINLIRVRAYTEVPKNTKITFQVSNTLNEQGEPIWYDSWTILNDSNDDVNSGLLYKYTHNEDVGYRDFYFGSNEHGYPTFQDMDFDYSNNDGFIIGDGGTPIIKGPTTYENSLWTKLPTKGNIINVRAVLYTTDINSTPKIYAPIGENNVKGLIESDDVAIHIEVNKEPEKPDIVEIKEPWDIPPQDPTEDELEFDPREGWIYTTTPILSWNINDLDIDIDPQVAYQVVLLANTSNGWQIAYNSDFIENPNYEFQVPTSYENDKNGFMWDIDSYEFGLAVRVMNEMGGISEFSDVGLFKVLAYERPRIANVVYPTETYQDTDMLVPKFNNIESHKVIEPKHTIADIITAKAGAQVTLILDSVGPIASEPLKNAIFYVEVDGKEVPLIKSDSYAINPLGLDSNRNRWIFNFFTEAPITKIPDDTIIKARIAGMCDTRENGGTTIFYIPDYAEGVVKTKDTIYSDWQVIIEGRDR